MNKHPISSNKLPPAAGPFVPAVQSNDIIFTSGQIGQDPKTGTLVEGGLEPQTKQALANLKSVVEAADKDMSDIIRVCIYLVDMADFAQINTIYADFMNEPYPARTCIAVAALPLGARFEIDAVIQA
ncbi:MAG: RidA family protein [Rhizobiales bacterium]|nr:RidA family protein [Hyphomicrobiales bacterium]